MLKHCSALFFGARAASNGRFRFFLNFWSGLGLEAIRALLAIRAIRTYCPARPEAPAHPVARRGDKATARGFEPLREEPNGFRVHLLSHSDTLSLRGRSRACDTSPPWRGGAMLQQRGSMSSCGQSPMDFESMSLANRIHGHIAAEAGSAPSRGEAGRHGDSGGGEGEAEPLRAEPNGFRINVLRHSDTLSMRGRRHARFDPAMPNPARHDPHARPSARRDRSSTPKRIRTVRCSESYSCTRSPKPIVDINAACFTSLRRIFPPCSFAEASSRRQKNGIAQSEVPHPTPAPTRRGRSTTSKRHRTIRSWQSFPRANSPRPIVDFNAE